MAGRGYCKTEFHWEKELGKGGFGTVWKAVRLSDNRDVAIKLIDKKVTLKKNMIQKVRDEANIHHMLRHSKIIELYDIFEDEESIVLVLEYCKHGDLKKYLNRHGRKCLSESEACTVVKQVLDGIRYLHTNGILHRDLKLENLLVDDEKNIKIADFGLATMLTHPGEMHETICGTPNYISPEVAREIPHGAAVDLWGLGVLLYTLLIGHGPFQTTNVKATLNRVITENIELPDHLSYEARDLLQKLLNKNPQFRITADQAARHQFFKKYRDTPLICDSQDSGIGDCLICSRWEQSTAHSTSNHPCRSNLHSGSKCNRSTSSRGCHNTQSSSRNGNYLSTIQKSNASFEPPRILMNNSSSNSKVGSKYVRSLTHDKPGSQLYSRPVQEYSRSYSGASTSNHRMHSRNSFQSSRYDGSSTHRQPSICEEEQFFSTKRLAPKRVVFQDAVHYILRSGDAVLEKILDGELSMFWVVTRDGYMSRYEERTSQVIPPPIPSDAPRYKLINLPPALRRPYRALATFVKSVQASTVKITLYHERGKCRLMESSPHDFSMEFFSGETVEKHGDVVSVVAPGCNEDHSFRELKDAEVMGNLPDILETFLVAYKKCLKLERMLTDISPDSDLFPANLGTCSQPQNQKHRVARAESTPLKNSGSKYL